MSAPFTRLAELEAAIALAMPGAQFGLRRRLQGLRRDSERGRWRDDKLEALARAITASCELREQRRAGVPGIRYDTTLPIFEKRAEIAEAICRFPAVIVCGETGSGKSTQLPKICLELGRGIDGLIGHTQPRRIAAQSIATRLAEELHVPLGAEVGYKIRFTDRTQPGTYIKLMTDGILLAETQGDRFLNDYDTLIIDEAHERSLNVDYLLGYLQRLLAKRPELRLIVTSATLDAARFQQYLTTPQGPAPVIEVSGRSYPVEVRYRPLFREEGADADLQQAIVAGVEELRSEPPGDVLIFLPTEREIRETAKSLRGWAVAQGLHGSLDILPLYARLSASDQQKIFHPGKNRRIVLATNVAESSLTVPGIRYVIDSGLVRMSRYSPKAKVQRLPIEAISRASADQRQGRCGRLGPGICLRLYAEDDYLARDAYTTPEIRRTNLAAVILQTKMLRLGAIEEFPFLDPPRPDAIRDGYQTLYELGALDESRNLTPLGERLGALPVDPRVARIVLAAIDENCLAEALIIAAALETQDPRERPVEKQQAADEAHRQFAHERSDFLSYLLLWDFYHHLRETLSRNQLRRACGQNFLSYNRLREWAETYRQLRWNVEQAGYRVPPRRDDYGAIHRALLTGLLSGIAYRREAYEYTGAGGQRLFLWPGSHVFGKRPKWVMAAELVETSKRYGRTVAEIDPAWLEPLAAHLVKRRHVAPFWSRRKGAAMIREKVSLFGLPIVTDRVVALGPLDPETARRMFIQHGLVEGDSTASFRFLQLNRQVLRKVLQLVAKARRSDWVIAEAAQFAFYDQRLPRDVYDLRGLKEWLPDAERRHAHILRMTQQDLLPEAYEESEEQQFPDAFPVDALQLPLEYRYEPGSTSDGITVVIPRELVPQLDGERFEWLVPGRLEEKITALIRALPKPIRRCLVPAPDTAREVARDMTFGQGPFLKTLARMLERRAGVEQIPLSDFGLEQLPLHLRFHFRIVDERGEAVASGRDWDALVRQLAGEPPLQVASDWHRDQIRTWDFDELPESIEIRFGPIPLQRFPTLVDQGQAVALRLFDEPGAAARSLRRGMRRLFVLAAQAELRAQIAWLPRLDELRVYTAPLMTVADLERQIADLIAERAFLGNEALPRGRQEFERALERGRERIGLAVQDVASLLLTLFEAHHAARLALEEQAVALWQYATDDMSSQLAGLTEPGFLVETPWEWLRHLPRYLQGIVYRLDRLGSGGLARDQRDLARWQVWGERYRSLLAEHQELAIQDQELQVFRWMLEEFRISLFAQPLGTSLPVSEQRLERQWAKVRKPGERK